MARYYTVVFLVNILFSGVFYPKARSFGISSASYMISLGLSVFVGILFPLFVGNYNMVAALAFTLAMAGACSYYIVRRAGSEAEIFSSVAAESQLVAGPSDKSNDICAELTEPMQDDDSDEPTDEVAAVDAAVEEESGKPEAKVEDDKAVVEIESDEPATKIEKGAATVEVAPDEPTAPVKPDEPTAPVEPDEPVAIEEVAASVAENKSGDKTVLFDAYIERGFEAKSKGELDLAIKCFISALDFNPPLDLEFMLVIDICAMYRELGQYNEAIDKLAEFQKKTASNMLPAMELELKTSFKYTETLYEMLVEANTPELPFSQVPASIKARVDEKVNQWRNQEL